MSNVHTKEWYEEYAKQNGLELGKVTDKILLGLERCDGHCPCKYALWQKTKPEQLDDIICPCSEHLDEIKRQGCCHCRMFVDPNFKKPE